jgi:hypothetical protein
MRFLPEVRIDCHICRSAFTVHNRVEMRAGRRLFRQEPRACPFCDAPIEPPPNIDVGTAKGLILLHAGSSAEKREHGTPEKWFARQCRTAEEVDAFVQLVRDMDYDAWEALLQKLLPYDRALRSEARLLPKIRRAAESGSLLESLGASAERVKRRLRARAARHLAIFAARKQADRAPAGGAAPGETGSAAGVTRRRAHR